MIRDLVRMILWWCLVSLSKKNHVYVGDIHQQYATPCKTASCASNSTIYELSLHTNRSSWFQQIINWEITSKRGTIKRLRVCTVNVGGVGGVESEFGGGGGGKSVEEARNSSSWLASKSPNTSSTPHALCARLKTIFPLRFQWALFFAQPPPGSVSFSSPQPYFSLFQITTKVHRSAAGKRTTVSRNKKLSKIKRVYTKQDNYKQTENNDNVRDRNEDHEEVEKHSLSFADIDRKGKLTKVDRAWFAKDALYISQHCRSRKLKNSLDVPYFSKIYRNHQKSWFVEFDLIMITKQNHRTLLKKKTELTF